MTTIAANDSNIVYSPYNWDVTAARAKTINAGAYLRVEFNGTPTSLAATFDVSNQPTAKTRVSIRIDNASWIDTQVAASIAIPLPADTWGSHTVEIVMRSHTQSVNRWLSPQPTALLFTGLTADTTITSRAIRKRPLTALAIGDSLGEGNASWSNASGANEDGHDARLGWAFPLMHMLGAEFGVVAFSGVAYSDTQSSNGVPKAPSSVPYLWDTQPRSLAATVPDFVVINLGTNDALHNDADATVTADALALINWVLQNTPAKTWVIVVPGWQGFKAGAIQAAITSSSAPYRVTYVDTSNWFTAADSSDNLHPYGFQNLNDLVPRLAATIRPTIANPPQSVRMYIRDAAGNAVPVQYA